MNNDFVFFTKRNEQINVTVYGTEHLATAPAIIYSHGFKGFKDWGFVPYTGNFFAQNGFAFISFNFSHNGVGGAMTEFVELEKFAANTISLEASELNQVLEAYHFGHFGDTSGKVFLLGHSRGGAISLFNLRKVETIVCAAVWASISKLGRYTERQKKEWRKKGFLEVVNSRTNQKMRMNVALLDDIEKHRKGMLNIRRAVTDALCPILIVHGEQDLTVPIKEADALYHWANKGMAEYVRIPNTGHTFGIVHPFEGTTPEFEKVLSETLRFFNKYK